MQGNVKLQLLFGRNERRNNNITLWPNVCTVKRRSNNITLWLMCGQSNAVAIPLRYDPMCVQSNAVTITLRCDLMCVQSNAVRITLRYDPMCGQSNKNGHVPLKAVAMTTAVQATGPLGRHTLVYIELFTFISCIHWYTSVCIHCMVFAYTVCLPPSVNMRFRW